ncbi:hypothetical protein FTO74_14275 [Granulicella sp. WH15]|uniref:hypothetical protein n=1 Tax=Granulicella sp. WH15 TaxID=2602070 RepID=UPI001367889E|nr:hypothetical protein [Granulicella sp. WH15]QHN04398.1 hypothetical protein FTO74_14275 [Granulicella sp. WH15]
MKTSTLDSLHERRPIRQTIALLLLFPIVLLESLQDWFRGLSGSQIDRFILTVGNVFFLVACTLMIYSIVFAWISGAFARAVR